MWSAHLDIPIHGDSNFVSEDVNSIYLLVDRRKSRVETVPREVTSGKDSYQNDQMLSSVIACISTLYVSLN